MVRTSKPPNVSLDLIKGRYAAWHGYSGGVWNKHHTVIGDRAGRSGMSRPRHPDTPCCSHTGRDGLFFFAFPPCPFVRSWLGMTVLYFDQSHTDATTTRSIHTPLDPALVGPRLDGTGEFYWLAPAYTHLSHLHLGNSVLLFVSITRNIIIVIRFEQ